MNQNLAPPFDNQDVDFRRILQLVLNNWLLILLPILVALIIAYVYNRYAQPIYEASGTIIVKDQYSNSLGEDAMQLGGLDIFRIKKSLSTEMQIIKSNSVVDKAVRAMKFDLRVSYFAKGRFKTTDLYKETPFLVTFDTLYNTAYEKSFDVNFLEGNKIKLTYDKEGDEVSRTFFMGEPIQTPYGIFRVQKRQPDQKLSTYENEYTFVIHHYNSLIAQYRGAIDVAISSEGTSILELSCKDQVAIRARDFVNTLIDVYSDRGIDEKMKVANNTINFIDEQLYLIRDSLDITEGDIEEFKRETGFTNLGPDFALGRFTDFDGRKLAIELQLQSLDTLAQSLRQGEQIQNLSPSIIGAQDPLLSKTLSLLNELEIKRNQMLLNMSPLHPNFRPVDRQISILREELIKNIPITRKALIGNMKTIETAITRYEKLLSRVPSTQRQYQGIQRNNTINENLFLMLWQEKTKASISKAATVRDNVVLDYAGIPSRPIRPKPGLAYIIAVLTSLTLSLSYIFVKDYLDDTIANRAQVEKATSVPVLGTINHARHTYESDLVVLQHPKSAVAEAFRSVRTNLQYLASDIDNKIIVVTSTVSGEGKTFFSMNIASILAITDKKVLLIGLDLRKPKLHSELGISSDTGISKVLIGKAKPEEVTFQTSVENLDVMPAGPIPPNPSELIMSERMRDLLNDLRKKYDYIVIDTPPIGLVTDALLAMKYADVSVYLLRQKTSKKEYLEIVNKLQQDNSIKNLAIVLNDIRMNSRYGYNNGYGYNYGYGYGYGYYEEKAPSNGLLKKLVGRSNGNGSVLKKKT